MNKKIKTYIYIALTFLGALAVSTYAAADNETYSLISKLSDDIGVMADRIGVMADRIDKMADKIGVMADRIVQVEQDQNKNVELTQKNILKTLEEVKVVEENNRRLIEILEKKQNCSNNFIGY